MSSPYGRYRHPYRHPEGLLERRKGAIELETVVVIGLAVLSVALILALLSGNLQDKAKKAFCSTYGAIIERIPTPTQGQAGLPEFCRERVSSTQQKQVLTRNGTIAARSIAGHVIACWKTTHGMRLGSDKNCYQLFFPYPFIDHNVTEQNVTDIIISEGACGIIENSDCSCGSRDEIIWDVDAPSNNPPNSIAGPSLITIQYNSTEDAIHIIA